MIDFGHRSIIFRYPEIVHPPTQVLSKLLKSEVHRDEPASSGQSFDSPFKLFERVIRPSDFGASEGKSKEVGIVCFRHLAFILVDRKFELSLKKPLDAEHHTFTGSLTFDKNDKVIGITNEAMSSSLQLLIQVIEENIRQKW